MAASVKKNRVLYKSLHRTIHWQLEKLPI